MEAYRHPECSLFGCSEPADYELSVQWTWFDFDEWFACLVHVPRVVAALQNKRVDGHPPAEIIQRAFENVPQHSDAFQQLLGYFPPRDSDQQPPPHLGTT